MLLFFCTGQTGLALTCEFAATQTAARRFPFVAGFRRLGTVNFPFIA